MPAAVHAGPRAASGWAEGPLAVQRAVAAAVAPFDGTLPGLVLVFPDAALHRDDVFRQAAAVAPGWRVAGMTSEGLVTGAGAGARGCAAMAFGPAVDAGIGLVPVAGRDMRAAGREATEAALRELPPGGAPSLLLLLLDPTAGAEGDAVDGAYSVAGPAVPLAGGGANGTAPAILADGVMQAGGVGVVALRSPGGVAVGVADGCCAIGGPAVATRTHGATILELDGLPAEEVYLRALGRDPGSLDDREFEALAVLHPLGQPELDGRLRLRHVIGPAPGAGLRCATPIPPGAAVWFTDQTPATILASARRAVQEAIEQLPSDPSAVLVFDCAARKRALGPLLAEEGRTIVSSLRGAPAVAGLYTRGEVARTRGAKGERSHVLVVVAFG